jgi:uncharacterized protein
MKTQERQRIPKPVPPRHVGGDGRRLQPAGEALVGILVALLLWAFIEAPRLKEAAERSPFGARRTASLIVLTPLAAVSEAVGLGALTRTFEGALGRDEGGLASTDAPEPLPTIRGPIPTPEEGVPAAFREPKPSNRLRVVVVGDSLAVGLARTIGAGMDPVLVRVVNQARISSGLARSDAFDWPAEVDRIMRQFRPDVVVVMLGTNDAQPIAYPDGRAIPIGTNDWVQAYRDQIDELISGVTSRGGRVAWVGLPTMEETFRRRSARRLNGHYRTQVKMHPGAVYVDTWGRFSRPDGSYAAYIQNDRGQVIQVREADGVHFTYTGYSMVANLVFDRLREVWDLPRDALT